MNMQVDIDDIKCIRDTAITIRGSRRRITVPADVVELLNLHDGDKLRWIVLHDGSIYIQKRKRPKVEKPKPNVNVENVNEVNLGWAKKK